MANTIKDCCKILPPLIIMLINVAQLVYLKNCFYDSRPPYEIWPLMTI
jgi:hypothetical protein